MVSIFKRLFRVAEAKTHSAIDKIEDPIKLTEQGIRDLRKDLESSLKGLAEAKSVLIRLRKDSEEKMELAASYENKAVLLLKKAESGGLVMEEADRLATAALAKKEEVLESSSSISKSLNRQEELTGKLDMRVQELKANIGKWENELVTLKARSKVAEASSKLNKQLAQVDSSGTLALLEKMKNKVAEEEALAESYGEMIDGKSSVDDEIDKAIKGSSVSPSAIKGADSLAALKSRLNIR